MADVIDTTPGRNNASGALVPRQNLSIVLAGEDAGMHVASALLQADGETPKTLIHILRLPEVINRVGLKRASIYHAMASSSFPKQIVLSSRAVGWIEEEIEAWLAARVTASRKK
jgi:prophage regulatory protein